VWILEAAKVSVKPWLASGDRSDPRRVALSTQRSLESTRNFVVFPLVLIPGEGVPATVEKYERRFLPFGRWTGRAFNPCEEEPP
jgi:hypothetical protein